MMFAVAAKQKWLILTPGKAKSYRLVDPNNEHGATLVSDGYQQCATDVISLSFLNAPRAELKSIMAASWQS